MTLLYWSAVMPDPVMTLHHSTPARWMQCRDLPLASLPSVLDGRCMKSSA